ncbi:MAG: hypothetical protein AB7S65_08285 [Sulfuricurvum sp.]
MGSDITNRVNVQIKKAYYVNARYGVDATFALLYHTQPLTVVELSKYVRISDHLISLDEHHFFIVFAFTAHDGAYKACQNLLYNLDGYFNDVSTCIALDTFDPSHSPQIVLNRLNLILSETRKKSFVRIETEEILDR